MSRRPERSRILIVEDDEGVARLERKQLERAGYEVVTATTTREALAHVEGDRIALVLLDYHLPGEPDGLRFHEHLQRLGHGMPVILVTGRSDEGTAIRALRAGVRDFVTKSAEYIEYLPEAVTRVLAQVRTEQQLAESEARLASLIAAAEDAFVVAESDDVWLGGDGVPAPAGVGAGRYVRLLVRDTGTGMTEDVRSRIFEPFFTTKLAGKGTGLGLSTVYGIVRQLSGHIDVYSEVGQGTVFKIYLPWAGDGATAAAGTGQAAAYPSGHEHVLVVEDDAAVREIIGHVLSTHGYQVTPAATAAAALAHVQTGAAVDLVVSDVMMPGMSGPAMVETITRLRPSVRVLFLSGYTEEASALTGLRPAHVAFLQKPFSFSALLSKTREVLQGSSRP